MHLLGRKGKWREGGEGSEFIEECKIKLRVVRGIEREKYY